MVVWRHGERRCELWTFADGSVLRVLSGNDLVLEEPFRKGHGWRRAEELRLAGLSNAS